MILILSPVTEITELLVKYAENCDEIRWNGFSEYNLVLSGKPCIIGGSGSGKVITALFTQHLIEKYSAQAIILCGLCASLVNYLKKGDIVLGRDFIQHDFDVKALGYEYGEIPGRKIRIINSDRILLEKAQLCRSRTAAIHAGRVLSGDQFITAENRAEKQKIFSELEGECVDMESAAAAAAACINNIPFLSITAVSDAADGKISIDFRKFCRKVSEDIMRVLDHLLKQL